MTPTEEKAKQKAQELFEFFSEISQLMLDDNDIIKLCEKVCDENIITLKDIKGFSKNGKLKFWKYTKEYLKDI
tara:strand:- start:13009 stop:13227 length:219 start_codon:yes stop_codon:yes gene_type:complete